MPSTMLSSELKAWDVIGRSVAVYAAADGDTTGAVCAVLARSAGVGANHKKLCQCDGTIIWEAGEDFLPRAVDECDVAGPLLGKGITTARRG
jgi:copper chaperone for superoxide dismutase